MEDTAVVILAGKRQASELTLEDRLRLNSGIVSFKSTDRAADVLIQGSGKEIPFIQALAEQLAFSGRFSTVYIAGPYSTYSWLPEIIRTMGTDCQIINTDSTLDRNLQAVEKTLLDSRYRGRMIGIITSDILPPAGDIRTCMDQIPPGDDIALAIPFVRYEDIDPAYRAARFNIGGHEYSYSHMAFADFTRLRTGMIYEMTRQLYSCEGVPGNLRDRPAYVPVFMWNLAKGISKAYGAVKALNNIRKAAVAEGPEYYANWTHGVNTVLRLMWNQGAEFDDLSGGIEAAIVKDGKVLLPVVSTGSLCEEMDTRSAARYLAEKREELYRL